ncbi:hypothetical protein [Pedobacter aquatilis]|uniref:hypothetical protein n=1 Tax=Pedobacter aquatilis TaxID=351343 RepID=UPI00292D8FC4|nr:hypothetical protein [Pedobacter aquatilis]
MKKYPRIKRLSTLGIVHHQNFDYEFSSFRTDFVGEGGAGKSMISDLLQLICVGTKAFHSPTKGTGPRKPHTMVLRTEGKGTDMGYAFINIEKAENQYLIIGIYLESSGTSNMFIIQNGNNFNSDTNLVPFSRILGVGDFQNNNIIFPINELKEHIQDNLNLTCESWERTSIYHKILFNNNLLPIDLSVSGKTLENYAKIIQAFSRESLDISKSSSVQTFLFGEEDEKELIRKFYATVEELQEDTRQFENNLGEIEALTTKQIQLSNLLDLKNYKEKHHQSFLIASYQFYNNQITISSNVIRNQLDNYHYSLRSIPSLKEKIEEKIASIKAEKEEREFAWEEAFRTKSELENKVSKRRKFSSWMQDFKCSREALIDKFDKYQKSITTIKRINELQEALRLSNMLTAFKSSEYNEKHIINQIDKQLEKIVIELELKNKLRALNNIEDKHSLAYWALQLPDELSLNQEAIIRKYQNEEIKIDTPVNPSKRYVPIPEALLNDIVIYKSEENGFWLDLNGVIEFFSTTFSPIFNTKDKNEIKAYFQKEATSIQTDILNLEKDIREKTLLKSVFESLENPDEYLVAWNAQTDLEDQLETHSMYEISLEDFKEYSNLYTQDLIEDDFKNSKAAFEKLDTYRNSLITLYENLERESASFFEIQTDYRIEDIKSNYNLPSDPDFNKETFLSYLEETENYYKVFQKLYNQEKLKYQEAENILYLHAQIKDIISKKNKIYSENAQIVNQDSELLEEVNEQLIEKLNADYDSANRKYIIEYNVLVRQYLKTNVERFENSGDFRALCEEILPSEIFSEINTLEREVIEMIDKYLKDINLKNKRLNNRKLQKLAVIIEEVASEVSDQRNDIRTIRNFLNADDKKITGGHTVSLEDDSEGVFSSDWMNVFTENINKDLGLGLENSLFESEKGITNDLEKYPSLKEKLTEAFYRSGGSRSLKPTIEELLNPKSYYTVKFSIKTNQGKKNDGSTSQTYAAISLLCIAKLSLLNRQSKNSPVEAIRFMAIDEAEGLGGNFDMLYKIALANDYQILSLSISPNKIDAERQNIYLLHNSLEDEKVNYDPVPIFGLTS